LIKAAFTHERFLTHGGAGLTVLGRLKNVGSRRVSITIEYYERPAPKSINRIVKSPLCIESLMFYTPLWMLDAHYVTGRIEVPLTRALGRPSGSDLHEEFRVRRVHWRGGMDRGGKGPLHLPN